MDEKLPLEERLQAYLEQLQGMPKIASSPMEMTLAEEQEWAQKSQQIRQLVKDAEYDALVALPDDIFNRISQIREAAHALYALPPKEKGK